MERKIVQNGGANSQQRCNQRITKSRARIEQVYAGLQQMGGEDLRCIGLERAVLQLNLTTATYNLRRLCGLNARVSPRLVPANTSQVRLKSRSKALQSEKAA